MAYVPRPIAQTILDSTDVPVLIVEGARAVGKTTIMREGIQPTGYHYVTFASEAERQTAVQDCAGWLRRLPTPFIVDEAQLLPELPLAVKEFVDETNPDRPVILTGSASIGRTGLGGADPLARRARRTTVWPLTAWELAEQPGNLVDALFDWEPQRGHEHATDDESLARDLLVGGFPGSAVRGRRLTRQRRLQNIRAGIEATIADGVLPGSRADSAGARAVLDGLLRNPGGILNVTSLAQRVDLDPRTVDRYIGLYERLFLLHALPNLATSAVRQTHARAKMHPVDTSFAVEAFVRAGVDIQSHREIFGGLLESHVVNQIVAAGSWSSNEIHAFYWRDAKTSREVDLVLEDGQGRLVGVEVKAATSVGVGDIAGLRSLADARRLHRGYVFYSGREVREIDADVWALPMGALADARTFESPDDPSANSADTPETGASIQLGGRADNPPVDLEPASEDAAIFVSYVHADDDRLQGRMVQFARDLADNYSFLYGRTVRLFIDRDNITWGENWRDRLTNEVSTTTFLLANATPRYLVSEACRREVTEFRAAAVKAGEPRLILPLLWVAVEGTDVVAADDPVRRALLDSQYIDVSDVRRLDRGSHEYDVKLENVTNRLRETVLARDRGLAVTAAPIEAAAQAPSHDAPESDVLTALERLEELEPRFSDAVEAFGHALSSVADALTGSPALDDSPSSMSKALARLRRELDAPAKQLEERTTQLADLWTQYEAGLARYVEFSREVFDREDLLEIDGNLKEMELSLEVPEAAAIGGTLDQMAHFSRHLVPVSRAVTGALRLVTGIQDSVRGWRMQLQGS